MRNLINRYKFKERNIKVTKQNYREKKSSNLTRDSNKQEFKQSVLKFRF
jgi:hypothetical protein